MKVAVIGDVHSTTNFLDAYMDIKSNHPDIEKIIVCGDWFDPYVEIGLNVAIERYNEAMDIANEDDRVVILIGNHDISGYLIDDGGTNRTCRFGPAKRLIVDCISKNLGRCYLVYKIGNTLFSHAGVSNTWFEEVFTPNKERLFPEMDLFQNGWTPRQLDHICGYSSMDMSNYGDNVYQGPTWIRPTALVKDMLPGYNQVVGHTRVNRITKVTGKDGVNLLNHDLWLVDNCQGDDYLILDVEEGE